MAKPRREPKGGPVLEHIEAILAAARAPNGRYPEGGHWISTKRLNDRFVRPLHDLGFPAGRKTGSFTVHSLRHFFKTNCVNAGILKAVVDTWQGHRIDQTVGAKSYKLADDVSQRFMNLVSFDTGKSAANADTQHSEGAMR